MKNARIKYRQDADSASVDHYSVRADGVAVATFAKPVGQADGAEQSVDAALDVTVGAHAIALVAVAGDGTESVVSGIVAVTFPLAAPVLVSVEPL